MASAALPALLFGALWRRFFQSRRIRNGVYATVAGILLAVLVILAGVRDASIEENGFPAVAG